MSSIGSLETFDCGVAECVLCHPAQPQQAANDDTVYGLAQTPDIITFEQFQAERIAELEEQVDELRTEYTALLERNAQLAQENFDLTTQRNIQDDAAAECFSVVQQIVQRADMIVDENRRLREENKALASLVELADVIIGGLTKTL